MAFPVALPSDGLVDISVQEMVSHPCESSIVIILNVS